MTTPPNSDARGKARRRGLILDRDGVINEDTGYLHSVAECRFIDGIFELTACFAAQGFVVAVATNQSGIGRGRFSEADFATLTQWMTGEFARHGVTLAAVYHCPDHPTEGLGGYRRGTSWRKPGPGMLLQAGMDLDLDLARSWSIGDSPRDIAAARAAGIGTIVHFNREEVAVTRSDDVWIVPRLIDIAGLLAQEAK